MGGEGMDLVNSYMNIGVMKRERGEYEKAIEYFNKALELKGDYANCYNNRRNAYFNMKRDEEAMKDYIKAIEINSWDHRYYNSRGLVYYRMGRY